MKLTPRIDYKSYKIDEPIFHIEEIKTVLLRYLNESYSTENHIIINNLLSMFNYLATLKKGEIDA